MPRNVETKVKVMTSPVGVLSGTSGRHEATQECISAMLNEPSSRSLLSGLHSNTAQFGCSRFYPPTDRLLKTNVLVSRHLEMIFWKSQTRSWHWSLQSRYWFQLEVDSYLQNYLWPVPTDLVRVGSVKSMCTSTSSFTCTDDKYWRLCNRETISLLQHVL